MTFGNGTRDGTVGSPRRMVPAFSIGLLSGEKGLG
jgi:hypothetical protein